MYRLIQEDYLDDPWKVLVCCIMLNKTHGESVRLVLPRLFSRWPTPADMSRAPHAEVFALIKHLGFGEVRTVYLIEMSARWVKTVPDGKWPHNVTQFAGCGRYAQDCWDLLIRKTVPLKEVQDKELRKYMAREGLL